LERDVFARPALALSVFGLATVVVFWSGLPPILAAGGGLLGWTGRNGTRGAGLYRAALAIAVLAVAADVAALVLDMTS
ncbi:MAG: hypothetical protein QOH00_1330, partial [Gaiellales bacterium]|nr:hypothetical protein [Gaiellales bacterium]